MKTCVIIPCYNHQETLMPLLKRISSDMKVFVVDDGSDEPVMTNIVEVIRFDRNYGKARALSAGFKIAKKSGFTHAITMDADGQHAPEFLDNFLEAVKKKS